jgi:hypothetical protein
VRRTSQTLLAALAVLLLAVGLVACGGGEDSTSSTSADASGTSKAEGKPADGASGQADAKDGDAAGKSGGSSEGGGDQSNGGSSAADFVPKQHDDSGGGSQQYTVKGGDNSVQEFGGEASGSEFEAAAAALHNFLDARAEGNWDAACEYMSKEVVESFEKFAAQAKQIDDTSCGALLETLTNPAAKPLMKAEAAKADVGSLRTDGDRSFVIYTGVEKGVFLAMPMVNEDGVWKVSSLAGTPLN